MAEKKGKRNRRASLRGWWKVLPFILGPMALLMTFAQLESSAKRNQLEGNALVEARRDLLTEIENLEVEYRDLVNIKSVSVKALNMQLVERNPDQLVEIQPIAIDESLALKNAYVPRDLNNSTPSRSVLVRIEYELAHHESGDVWGAPSGNAETYQQD